MSDDDPFAEPSDTEKTVIRAMPKPSMPPRSAPPPPPQQRRTTQAEAPIASAADSSVDGSLAGLNPLCIAAAPLFSLVGRIRNRAQHSNPDALREAVAREVRNFEQRALRAGVPAQTIRIARYLICATIDDVVLNTPWGSESSWTTQSMVGTFHKETVGGDRVYDLLTRLEQEPSRHAELLEFLYICLSLGFEGRLRVEERGSDKHYALRDGLARLIRQQRGDTERDLSPRWKGLQLPHRPLAAWAPLWLIGTLTAGLLALIFFVLSWLLSGDTDRAQGQLAVLLPAGAVDFGRKPGAPPPPPPPPPPPAEEVQLQEEVAELGCFTRGLENGTYTVIEKANTRVIRITGARMFASGSDTLRDEYEQHIACVAERLKLEAQSASRAGKMFGPVLIVGHSDSDKISTARFPDNTALSLARAKTVMEKLGPILSGIQLADGKTRLLDRLTAEGRAFREPLIDPERSSDDKAKNRRIEVVIVKSG